MLSISFLGVAIASAALHGVAAQQSLYIPGFDPQPVTASVLGVAADGSHTTWGIAPGQPSGTLSDVGFNGPATLIEGPNDAEIIVSDQDEYVSASCGIANGLANCIAVATAQGIISTETFQETASPFAVQVGDTAAPTAGNSPSSPAASPTPTPTPTPTPNSPSPATGNTSPLTAPGTSPLNPTTPTNQPSSAFALAASSFLSGVIGTVAAVCLL